MTDELPVNATYQEQWAWPFDDASEDDRLGHMAGAHGFLIDDVELHAKLHGIGHGGRVPHEHLTPLQALMLRGSE